MLCVLRVEHSEERGRPTKKSRTRSRSNLGDCDDEHRTEKCCVYMSSGLLIPTGGVCLVHPLLSASSKEEYPSFSPLFSGG